MGIANGPIDRRASRIGHLLVGLVGTTGVTIVLLPASKPAQEPLYAVLFESLGPWSATVTATAVTFVVVGGTAISVPTIVAAVRGGFDHVGVLVLGAAILLVDLSLFLVLSASVGAIGIVVASLAVAAFVALAVMGLRFVDMWDGVAGAFLGGLPVLAVLVVLLGVGLGWGGGYTLVATEVPPSATNGSPSTTLDDTPILRDDLLDADGDVGRCGPNDDGMRTCRLPLRDYEHEATAARFLDRHGVRCPYIAAGPAEASSDRSVLVEHRGTTYRIACSAVDG